MADLVDWCAQEGVDPTEAMVSGGQVTWLTPETVEEQERREKAEADSDQRRHRWETEQLGTLAERHGYRLVRLPGLGTGDSDGA